MWSCVCLELEAIPFLLFFFLLFFVFVWGAFFSCPLEGAVYMYIGGLNTNLSFAICKHASKNTDKDIPTRVPAVRHLDTHKPTTHHTHSTHPHTNRHVHTHQHTYMKTHTHEHRPSHGHTTHRDRQCTHLQARTDSSAHTGTFTLTNHQPRHTHSQLHIGRQTEPVHSLTGTGMKTQTRGHQHT